MSLDLDKATQFITMHGVWVEYKLLNLEIVDAERVCEEDFIDYAVKEWPEEFQYSGCYDNDDHLMTIREWVEENIMEEVWARRKEQEKAGFHHLD
jgi:hypothetical protein